MKLQTLFLKAVIFIIGIPVFILCIFGLIWLTNNPANPEYAYLLYPVIIGMYISMIPFYTALYQAFKLLCYIDKNKVFSELSMNALKNIKYCAAAVGTIYGVCLPFVFLLAEKDDAPGLVIVGMIPIFASIVIAVFVDMLQKLFKSAIDKLEQVI